MTDEEILIRAMDAEPADIRPMAALADLLLEKGDARGEGLAVLAQHGKVGLPTDGKYPLYTAYHGSFEEFTVGYGKTEQVVPLSAIIDPEWHLLSLPKRYRSSTNYTPNQDFDEQMLAMTKVAHSRMVLAKVWADADVETRTRMAFHTAPAKENVQPPDVEVSRRWLTEYAAKLNTSYYCSYRQEEIESSPCTFEELMDRAAEYQDDEEYWSETGRFDGFNNDDTFWCHYAIVTGKMPIRTGNFFGCSC